MKKCLLCGKIYSSELSACSECASELSENIQETMPKSVYQIPKEYVSVYEDKLNQQEPIEPVNLTKIPKIKNPNLFFIFGGILVIFLILTILCCII